MSRSRPIRNPAQTAALALAGWFCLLAQCQGQGTIRFEGQPTGTTSTGLGTYSEAGMKFINIAPGGMFLSGGGNAGYPDNGTGYLYTPDNGISLEANSPFPAVNPFNLISFDAAEYWGAGPSSLMVVGYIPM